jgi:hypothetical protein
MRLWAKTKRAVRGSGRGAVEAALGAALASDVLCDEQLTVIGSANSSSREISKSKAIFSP